MYVYFDDIDGCCHKDKLNYMLCCVVIPTHQNWTISLCCWWSIEIKNKQHSRELVWMYPVELDRIRAQRVSRVRLYPGRIVAWNPGETPANAFHAWNAYSIQFLNDPCACGVNLLSMLCCLFLFSMLHQQHQLIVQFWWIEGYDHTITCNSTYPLIITLHNPSIWRFSCIKIHTY